MDLKHRPISALSAARKRCATPLWSGENPLQRRVHRPDGQRSGQKKGTDPDLPMCWYPPTWMVGFIVVGHTDEGLR